MTEARVVWAGDHTTRPTADAPLRSGCGESVTYFHDGIVDPDFYPLPDFATVSRVREWQRRPLNDGASWSTVLSYHEAGHAVCAEAFGWPGVSAWQDGERGLCSTENAPPAGVPTASPPGASPAQVAVLATYPHAGVVAEQILSGRAWVGPIGMFDSTDFACAEGLLAPHFGFKNSGAHYYAQRWAANILAARWTRVQEIARHLMQHGEWHA